MYGCPVLKFLVLFSYNFLILIYNLKDMFV